MAHRWLIAVAAVVLAAAHTALGDDAQIVALRAGWEGVLPAERWSPVWVTVRGGDRPQQLTLTVRYGQDATQEAVMSTPVATTPGQELTVPILVCPPEGVGRIDVSLTGQGSRPRRAALSRTPARNELPLAIQPHGGAIVVGTLGTRVPQSSIEVWNGKPANLGATVPDSAVLLRVERDDLPQTWVGLDGLSALVLSLRAVERCSLESITAVQQWMEAGGRLVLVLDAPGDGWKSLVPSGVFVQSQLAAPVPASIAALMPDGTHAAPTVICRGVVLDAEAAVKGWTATAHLYPDEQTTGPTRPAVVASGPVGGGWLVLVGADPSLMTGTLDDQAAAPIWQSLLERALPEKTTTSGQSRASYYYRGSGSGDGQQGEAALRSTIDGLISVPPTPGWVFVAILGFAAALGAGVSVGDYVILGRLKLRHRAWLSGGIWVIGACAAAWLMPDLLRREPTTLGRGVVIDVLPGADGQPVALHSGVTTIFAARSGTLLLNTHGQPTSGYWRGVSSLVQHEWNRSETNRALIELPLVQRVSALASAQAAVVPGEQGTLAKQWTLRSMMDFGRGRAVPRVTASQGTNGWDVSVAAVPQEWQFESGAIKTADGWLELAPGSPSAAGSLRLVARGQPASQLPRWFVHAVPRSADDHWDWAESRYHPSDPATLLLLDGPRRRTPAFEAMLSARQHVTVHVVFNSPGEVSANVPIAARGRVLMRVCVPLDKAQP